MFNSLFNLSLTGFVALACLGAGRTLLLKFGFRFASQSEESVVSTGVGLGILIYVMVLLGTAKLYQSMQAWGLLLTLALVGLWGWWHIPLRLDLKDLGVWSQRLTLPLAMLLVVLTVYCVAYLSAALTPTLEGDSLAGYLLAVREYARHGGIISVDYAYTNSYPANGQMLATLGFLLHGQILAQLLLVWLTGLLSLGVIYAFGRNWLSRRSALVAMAAWYGMYSVSYISISAKIDLAWVAFDLLALLAFSHWYFSQPDDRHWRWLVLAGFFLGVAGGIKQASAFTAIVLSVAVAIRLWQDGHRRPKTWITSYVVLGLPASLALLWVIRTYSMTGSLAFTGSHLRGDNGVVGFFRTLWQMSMLGNATSVEGPLGKPIGPTILASVPLLVLFHDVERRSWHILAFCGMMLVLWFNGVQRARHLLPTLALLSLLAGYTITLLLNQWPRLGQAFILLMSLSLMLNLGVWSYVNKLLPRLPYVVGLQDMDSYLAVNLPKSGLYPNYPMVAYVHDHVPTDARIAALSSSNSYYLDRPFYTNWTQTPADISNPNEFVAKLKAAGITHVFVNDYVVRIRGLDKAWLALPRFQTEYLRKLCQSGGQCLYVVK